MLACCPLATSLVAIRLAWPTSRSAQEGDSVVDEAAPGASSAAGSQDRGESRTHGHRGTRSARDRAHAYALTLVLARTCTGMLTQS